MVPESTVALAVAAHNSDVVVAVELHLQPQRPQLPGMSYVHFDPRAMGSLELAGQRVLDPQFQDYALLALLQSAFLADAYGIVPASLEHPHLPYACLQ